MKQFAFEYEEHCIGFIIVDAENEEQARELIACGEGERCINKSDENVGKLIEM